MPDPTPPADPFAADFRRYLWLCWKHLGLPDPTRLQYDIAHWMQHGPARQVIMCFRGFGKSYIDCAYQNWVLYRDQSLWTLQVSSNKQKADDKIALRRRLIAEMPIHAHMRPDRDSRDSKVQFDVAGARAGGSPSARSVGITSNLLQGSRAHDIGADDIESRQNSQTVTMHERTWESARELGGAIVTPQGEGYSRVRFFGTPQIPESGYFDLPSRGYSMRVYPARYPTPEEIPLYKGHLAPILMADLERDPGLAGRPTEPDRFDEGELQFRLAEYRERGFAMQFMLLPFAEAEDVRPLKLRDMVVMNLDRDEAPEKVVWSGARPQMVAPDELKCVGLPNDHFQRPAETIGKWRPYQRKVMAIDPAGRGKDELGYAIGGELNSQIFLLDFGGMMEGTSERSFRALAELAVRWGVGTIIYEKTWGGGMWGQLFGPTLRDVFAECDAGTCRLEDTHGTGRKELRIIDTIEPVLTQHRLIVNQEALERDFSSAQKYGEAALDYQLCYQLTRITHDRGCLVHDDRLDALEILCRYFVESMGQDYKRKIEKAATDDLEEQLRQFTGHITGRQPKRRKSWIKR